MMTDTSVIASEKSPKNNEYVSTSVCVEVFNESSA